MYIENLKISNFRNIKKADINLNKKINFIIGSNAQGKTNIIESVYVTAFLKSFRTQKNSDLIKIDKNEAKIKINIINNNVKNNIELSINSNNKILKVNNKKPDDHKYLNVVIFHPDEINYINNYPVFRRNLIDRSIFYTDYNYINLYKKYFKCLKQRNINLKNNNDQSDCWTNQLIDYGSKIIIERLNYIEKINNFFSSEQFININSEEYSISYSKKYPIKLIENCLRDEFTKKQDRERQLGYTLVGPHKDDILFYLNGRPAETFASQGQKRSMIISYKTAQILDYKTVQGHYPVLILDDMTSELDTNRKNILLENLLENSGQVFITSTEFKRTNLFEQSKVFKVINGDISIAD